MLRIAQVDIVPQCADVSRANIRKPPPTLDSQANDNPNIPAQARADRYGKGGKQVANERSGGVGKNSANYRIGRLFKPVNSEGVESSHFSMKVQYLIGNRFPAPRGAGPEFEAGSGDFHARSAPDGAVRVQRSVFRNVRRVSHHEMPVPARGVRLEMRASHPPLRRLSDGSSSNPDPCSIHTIRQLMQKLTLILAFMALATSAVNGGGEGTGVSLEEATATVGATPDPAPPFVASIGIVNGLATISVNSFSGYWYQLETSESLDSGWVPLNEELVGNGATLKFTDSTPLSAVRFYRIQRRKAGVEPGGFGLASFTNAAPDSLVTSNSILVSVLGGTAIISIQNGKYSIDGSAFTDADGIISNGQVITLQQMAAAQRATTIDTVLTIDSISDSFSVTTSTVSIPTDRMRRGNLEGVRVWQLPNAPNGDRPDQCWLAVGSHPNGDIYISGHDHVSNSMLYRLHQSDGVVRWVGDAETASRKVNNWLPGESAEKFHTRPIAHDGRVYVATLDSSNMNNDYLNTRGFHWYGYEPLDNELLDLSVSEPGGVGWPTLQIVTMQKDVENNLLYGMSIPRNELVRYDIDRAETTLLGKPSAWTGYFYSNRFMWVDSRGRVYMTGGSSRPQWHKGESASTFDHVWYYDPVTGFGELQDFPLQGPNAMEVGQWDRTGQILYTADDQGNIYRFTDATASWSFVGRPNFSGIGKGVPKTWVFQLSADAEKIYIGVSDVSYPNSIWEFDIASGITTQLAKLSELDTIASTQAFITGYDSWDANGSFYISSFSMYNGVNVYMVGIDPVRIKAAKDSTFDLVEVSSQAAGSNISISRTGSTDVDLEVLYEVTLYDAFGAKLQSLPGQTTIGVGQETIELSEIIFGLSPSATFAYAEFRLVADGNDYVLADNAKIILK